MDDETVLLFVEDYVRRHGPTKISYLSKLLNINKKYLRELIKSSIGLSVDGWYAKLRELVQSEFGEVTPEELVLLRRYDVPTLSDLEERKRFILETTSSPHVSDSSSDESSDLFAKLILSTIEALTQLTRERSRQVASQIGAELLPSNAGRFYDLYIYVCSESESTIKGWAAVLVNRDAIVGKFSGCMTRVSVPYVYMSVINKILKFIPPRSSVNIMGSSRNIKRIERGLFGERSRLTFSEKKMSDSLLSTMSSYSIKFAAPLKRASLFRHCRKLAVNAKRSLFLRGVKNGSI